MKAYTVDEVTALTDLQVLLGDRQWPAFLTGLEMRAQLLHEAKGYPLPFPGAVWKNGIYTAAPEADRAAALLADALGLRLSIDREGKWQWCRRVEADCPLCGFASAEAAVQDAQAARRRAAMTRRRDWVTRQKRLPAPLYWRRWNLEYTKRVLSEAPQSPMASALVGSWPAPIQRALRRRFGLADVATPKGPPPAAQRYLALA